RKKSRVSARTVKAGFSRLRSEIAEYYSGNLRPLFGATSGSLFSESGFRCSATVVFGKLKNHERIGISHRRQKSHGDGAGESGDEASSTSREALTEKVDTWHRVE
ncbi:hypothetical protein U1Q18_030828, partial [Sarracenia purpurea var. burkii]